MKKLIFFSILITTLTSINTAMAAGNNGPVHHRKIHVSDVHSISKNISQATCEQLHEDFSVNIHSAGSDKSFRPEFSFDINDSHGIGNYRKISRLNVDNDHSVLIFMGDSKLRIKGETVTLATTITTVYNHASDIMHGVISNQYCLADFVSTLHKGGKD